MGKSTKTPAGYGDEKLAACLRLMFHAGDLLHALESVERFTVGRIDHEHNLPDDERAMLATVRDAIARAKGVQS